MALANSNINSRPKSEQVIKASSSSKENKKKANNSRAKAITKNSRIKKKNVR